MKTLQEILTSFSQTFTNYIEQKPVYSKGSKAGTVDYIPWHYLCDILDNLAPGWEWEITCDYHGERTVVTGKLTIHGSDRSISRSATGNETNDCGSYGDPVSNAEAMALRRACAKFGIGRYLWAKEAKQQPQQSTNSVQPKPKSTGKGVITREEWLHITGIKRKDEIHPHEFESVEDEQEYQGMSDEY